MTQAPTINAIPTAYQGVTFRSRTEARWAKFFDVLGIEWQYEVEGYTDGTHYYLPDFWLPDVRDGCFWEIKGVEGYDDTKVEMVARVTKRPVFVAVGVPSGVYPSDRFAVSANDSPFAHIPVEGDDPFVCWDNLYFLCRCTRCGTWGVEYRKQEDRLRCHCLNPKGRVVIGSWADEFRDAAIKADLHRFWDPAR